MVFRTTFIKRSRRAGFTLAEILVSLGIASLLLIVCLLLGLHTTRSIASLTDSVDLGARSRHAIDRMGQKLRQASAVSSFSPASVSVTCKGRPLTYTYDPTAKTLVENDNGQLKTHLVDCDSLTFALYKRAPIGSSFEQFPAQSKVSEAKVIKVNWRCSRTMVSQQSGSAELASARIVLRAN